MTEGAAVPSSGPLSATLSDIQPPLCVPVLEQLAQLFEMVRAWRGAGIVGFRSPEDLARYYFREALLLRTVLPERGPYLDIGSGGGTPALPLALACDSGEWILLEPRRGPAGFLEMATETLGLTPRVRVIRQRLKDFLKSETGRAELARVSAVTMRAVKLQTAEWKMLAGSMPPGAPVIWPTTRPARERAAIARGLFEEDFIPAERGVVWTGRPHPGSRR